MQGRDKVRIVVIGAGHIAQVAVLPAFAHTERAELAGIVSGNAAKRKELAARYNLDADRVVDYDGAARLLERDDVDAVFVCTPNHLHREHCVLAARAGVHVLCEKPLGVTVDDCVAIMDACEAHDVMLMTAYRLHFEPATLDVLRRVRSGQIGDLKVFESVFTQNVTDEDNVRLLPTERGGGPLYDIGVYCINAARMLFDDEPESVLALPTRSDDPRFADCDEAVSALLCFPGGGLASFTVSFAAHEVDAYRIVGTKGSIHAEPAYGYVDAIAFEVENGQPTRSSFGRVDQFAGEIDYFARCIQQGETPEPDGREALADLHVIEAILESLANDGKRVRLATRRPPKRPQPDAQTYTRPPVTEKPDEVEAEGPK